MLGFCASQIVGTPDLLCHGCLWLLLLLQGTLREALDKRQLPRLPGTGFTHPSVVYSLSHDIAAAMLHLHSEGIV